MYNKENLLEQLSSLLAWKKSKQFMADKLQIPIEEVNDLLAELRGVEKPVVIREDQLAIDDILGVRGIDGHYNIAGGWVKHSGVSIRFNSKEVGKGEQMKSFTEFLAKYEPAATPIENKNISDKVSNACLIVNKQDAHLNKYDVNGSNNIHTRFNGFMNNLTKILKKSVATANLENVIYAIGSDEFNSEWTGRTVHDTPQQNILNYHEGFEAICNHEVDVINLLQEYTHKVHVLYIPGNHDTYVGWHMVSWLKTYFRNCPNVHFDVAPTYTKYVKYGKSALCFNHGYVVKPEALAQNFPIEFKEHWSHCNNFYIFAGDKHTELARTIGGIKFYRLAQISKSKSDYDSERGYTLCKGEITAFLLDEVDGLTDVYHQTIG